jgi:serine acetyltransferase
MEPTSLLVIRRGALVSMGAIVTKSVPLGVTVVGIPSKTNLEIARHRAPSLDRNQDRACLVYAV